MDIKSPGPNSIGLIKQNRKGKYTFEGKYPLVKFGMFTESSEASASHESSNHMTVDEDVIMVSDHDENRVPPVATVAEEHELTSVQVQGDYSRSVDAENNDEDSEDADSLFGGNLSPHCNDNLDMSFIDSVYSNHEDMETIYKIFGDEVQQTIPPVLNQTANSSNPIDTISGLPPPNVVIPTTLASASDSL